MPPRRQPLRGNRRRGTGTGEEIPNIAQLVSEQFMASLPTIVTQVAAGFNAARGNAGGDTATDDARRCTYKSFMSCKPKEFHGNEGAIGLLKWIEGMETVLHISKCSEADKVEYASCQLQDRAQTWWKTEMQVRGREAAYRLTWEEFTNLLMEEYCSKDEKQKLESEFWNHSMEGLNIEGYTVRFQELARLVPHMVTPEEKRIDRYIWGLAPAIRGMVTSVNPTTIQSAVVLAKRLTNDLIRSGMPSRSNPKSKRRLVSQSGKKAEGNANKNKKRTRNFGTITRKSKRPTGLSTLCNKCNQYHQGGCRRCFRCNKKGHHASQCEGDARVCYGCGSSDHLRSVCPRSKGEPL